MVQNLLQFDRGMIFLKSQVSVIEKIHGGGNYYSVPSFLTSWQISTKS